MRYEILSEDVCIGWSELEFGDPPMGVVHGRFYPSPLYRSDHAGPNARLRARPEGTGQFFQPSGGVFIEDFSDESGPEAMEVSVLGLDEATYLTVFPHHVKAYEEQFRSK